VKIKLTDIGYWILYEHKAVYEDRNGNTYTVEGQRDSENV
jgi:hypothetical protein